MRVWFLDEETDVGTHQDCYPLQVQKFVCLRKIDVFITSPPGCASKVHYEVLVGICG
jgi:hypothetical protein